MIWYCLSHKQVDCKKGPPSDKAGFTALTKELSDAFRPKGLLLSAAVSPSKAVMDKGYDIPRLAKYLDWIAVMTYDYHGHWDKQTGHVSPMYYRPDDQNGHFNTVSSPLDNGPPHKQQNMSIEKSCIFLLFDLIFRKVRNREITR